MLEWEITNDFGKEEPTCLEVKLKDDTWEAYIKWDGCVEISHEDFGNLHICDIPRFIEMLQSLEDFRMKNIKDAE